jgi:hypothetical protein
MAKNFYFYFYITLLKRAPVSILIASSTVDSELINVNRF